MSIVSERSAVRKERTARQGFVILAGGFVLLALVRAVTNSSELTSSGTFGAALRLGVPILLAGLGALFAERAGIVNIGLEGMMILGTWFGAWGGIEFGPWWGVVAGVVGGALGGLLHAIATVTFGIDHIVSGVAINILGESVARFLSVIFFTGIGGSETQSPAIPGTLGKFSVPIVAGGPLFGWQTPDLFGWLERKRWFLISDLGAFLKGMTSDLSWLVIIAALLVVLSFYVLWRTRFGLRLRSVGEHPLAAESLGIRVYTMKYVAVIISGGLAGLGGAFLVYTASGIYQEGQVGGRGFIGLAALIFGNWRPGGVAAAAGIFGYSDALQLRSDAAVHGLLLFAALGLAIAAVWLGVRGKVTTAVVLAILSGLVFWWFAVTKSVPRQFIAYLPHFTTLLVLALATQRLRPPAADGKPYRRGQAQ